MASKRPAIVAELGRPETPQETADRKAASSARYRGSKTLVNLVAAMIATLGIVIVMVVVVMRHDVPAAEPVDVAGPAADASAVLGAEAVAPDVPDSWAANVAELRTGPADIAQWYVGYVIDGDRAFASVTQGVDADATWLAGVTREATSTGETTIDGVEWTIADQRDRDDVGNLAYVASATIGASTLVVAGTADDDELRELMTAVTAELAD